MQSRVENDTLNIWLNNNNKKFGNGVVIKIFADQYFIKDFDPRTLRGEEKFIPSKPISQKLLLHKSMYQKNDSIYGFINYHCLVDGDVEKHLKGYFRTIIK